MTLASLAERFGFRDRWAFRARYLDARPTIGLSGSRLDAIYRDADAIPRRKIGRGERPVRARVPRGQISGSVANRFEQRLGKTGWSGNAERVAIARRILGGNETRFAGHGHGNNPAIAL